MAVVCGAVIPGRWARSWCRQCGTGSVNGGDDGSGSGPSGPRAVYGASGDYRWNGRQRGEAETADVALVLRQPGKWPAGLNVPAWRGAASGGRKSRRLFTTQPDMGELEDTELEPGLAELMDGVDTWAMREVGNERAAGNERGVGHTSKTWLVRACRATGRWIARPGMLGAAWVVASALSHPRAPGGALLLL